MRVLHLLEPDAGEEGVLACREASARPEVHHDVWLVGNSAAERFARAAGIDTSDRVSPPLGSAALAGPGLRRLVAGRPSTPPDLVQCYSPGALGAARLVFPRVARVGFFAAPPPAGLGGSSLAPMARFALGGGVRAPTVLTVGDDSAAAWAACGARDVRRCRALPPAPFHDDPDSIRRELVVRAGPPPGGPERSWVVVALLGDPPTEADARRFVFILGLIYTTGQRVVGVIPRGCGSRRRAARFVRAHGRQWGLVEAQGPLAPLLGTCDVAMACSTRGGALLAAAACARGVPVIAPPRADLADLLGPAADRCIAVADTSTALAARLLPLVEDVPLRRDIGARIRRHAGVLDGTAGVGGTLEAIWRETLRLPAVGVMPVAAREPEAVCAGAAG